MTTLFYCRRALALGLFTLPVFVAISARATNYSVNTNVSAKVTGNANVGVNATGSHTDSKNVPYSPTVNFLSGATITGELDIYNHSTATLVTGGNINTFVYAHDTAIFTMSGGTVGMQAGASDVYAQDTSTVTINGGTIVGQLSSIGTSTAGRSTVNFNAGSVGTNLYAVNNGLVNYAGGTVTGSFYSQRTGLLNFMGSNFSAVYTGVDGFGDNIYQMTGTLADGVTSINGKLLYLQNGSGAAFSFNGQTQPATTPAPGSLTILLAGFAGAGIRLAHNRRKSLSRNV